MNEGKKNENALVTQMREENGRLSKKIDDLYNEKAVLEKKLYRTQQAFEDRMSQDRETIEKLNEKIFVSENKLKEKTVSLEVMKNELQKYVNHENTKKFRHVFVVEPSKANVDLNNELNYTRDILAKISKLMNSEKTKTETMQGQINNLQNELNLYRKNNKAFQLDCLANNIKLESIDNDDLDGSEEDDIEVDLEEETNLESPSLKFPDKVSMKNSIKSGFSGKNVPKLDFTKVNAKYKSSNMKVDLKDIKIKDYDKLSEYNSVSKPINYGIDDDKSLKESTKTKSEIVSLKKMNHKLRNKIEKYRKVYNDLKEKFIKLSNTLKLAQNKIEVLENHVKKNPTNMPSTEDTVNKRNLNNTSMNANTSVREDMFSQFDEEEVTYTMKDLKQKKKMLV